MRHWKATKKDMRYPAHQRFRSDDIGNVLYADLRFAGSQNDMKSTSCYVFKKAGFGSFMEKLWIDHNYFFHYVGRFCSLL